jgi:ParB family chromosome partitioning protein
MQKLKISELKEHPQNTYYFDEMEGEKWKEFLESVKTSGVIEPIVCTQNKIIVSGHQRVRACKELGMEEINCEVRIYDDDDKIIKDLLETNIRQRGEIGGSSVKIGRRIRELERLYGIRQGSAGKGVLDSTMSTPNQQDLMDKLGLSKDTYLNYKKLTTLIPELQNLVDDKISPSVASRVLSKLTQEEQQDLINTYSKDIIEKLSMTKAKELVEEYKNQSIQASDVTADLAIKNKELTIEFNKLKDYSNREQNNLKSNMNQKQEQINRLTKERELLIKKANLNDEEAKKYQELKQQINTLTQQKDNLSRKINSATELSGLTVEVKHYFDNKFAPIKYSRAIQEASNDEIIKQNLTEILNIFQGWIDEMNKYINCNDFTDVEVIE